MEIKKYDGGFSLALGGVEFDFASSATPVERGELVGFDISGVVPTPVLEERDRILIPMGEGIALTVGEEELVNNAFGDFCSKQGTVCMVIVERGGKYLLISLENGKYIASLQLAHKISKYFDMKIEDVFIFEED